MRASRLWGACFFLALAVCAGGCATDYQSSGLTGGYGDTRLAPDAFRVTFDGNAYTSGERAQDFALLRASELTLANGFKYFAIVDESSSTTVSAVVTPGTAQTTGNAYVYGNYGTYSGTTTYVPPQVFYSSRPRTGLLIRCFRSKPESIYTFDATFLQQSLKEKYKIK